MSVLLPELIDLDRVTTTSCLHSIQKQNIPTNKHLNNYFQRCSPKRAAMDNWQPPSPPPTNQLSENPLGEKCEHGQGQRTPLPTTGKSLAKPLRFSLLSLREAFFCHATFLEFLPAPERVDRKRFIPEWDVEGSNAMASQDEMGEQIDSEV